MTLDEAIQHAESNAAQHEKWSKQKYFENESWNEESKKEHILAAEEQRQFASWLTELKERRAADVQEVKRGKWTWDSNAPHREHGAYKCSNCGCHSDFEENYCYNCGAAMTGGDSP